jgi:predicted transcriptional regulator
MLFGNVGFLNFFVTRLRGNFSEDIHEISERRLNTKFIQKSIAFHLVLSNKIFQLEQNQFQRTIESTLWSKFFHFFITDDMVQPGV